MSGTERATRPVMIEVHRRRRQSHRCSKGINDSGGTMENQTNVVVIDVRMPFWSMVVFMVKWVIASIPAFIILLILAGISAAMFGGLMSGMMH